MGNLNSDSGKNLSAQYNFLDLPYHIASDYGVMDIVYDANGKKLKQTVTQGGTTEVWLYQDGIEYRDDERQSIYHEEGRVVYDEPLPVGASTDEITYPEWFLKDHLGNVRARLVDKDASGDIQVDMEDDGISEITGSYHYYPFGMEFEGRFHGQQVHENRYRYNGKEFNEEAGWYDYGARWYDATISRFTSVDRFTEKYVFQSPFVYAANNPIKYIDVNGDSIGVNILKSTSQEAFDAFFATKEGKAFIGQFAAKGQSVNGHTFKADGKYHDQGIDLFYSDRDFGEGEESTGAETTGGTKGGTFVDGRLKLGVSMNTTTEETSLIDRVNAITHESFLHVQEYSFDYSDNGKLDFSHDPFYDRTKNNSPNGRHHLMGTIKRIILEPIYISNSVHAILTGCMIKSTVEMFRVILPYGDLYH